MRQMKLVPAVEPPQLRTRAVSATGASASKRLKRDAAPARTNALWRCRFGTAGRMACAAASAS
eukprot:12431866-Alexandrium_andersonii.AAC.1